MISCPRCGTKFHQSEPNCPGCGVALDQIAVPRPQDRRCGPVAFFLLQYAWVFALLSALASTFIGVWAIVNGKYTHGMAALLVAAPIAFGHFIALGLVIQYAERRG